MDFMNPPCETNNTGAISGLIGLLLQTLSAAQCAKFPKWPKDYGPEALNQGK